MDPTYSAEAQAYRAKIKAFLADNLPAGWKGLGALSSAERTAFTEQWRQTLADNQLLAVAWPKEYGGAGLSQIEQVIINEEFARAGVPQGVSNDGFGIGMIGPTIMVWGTEDQKKHYIPRILSGE
ncbi:MAG: acyl-CoA dehydrogenase family protein, partial [Acidimicrobiia bacterium]